MIKIKLIILICISVVTLNAGLVNAVAIIVDNKVITLLDIDRVVNKMNLDEKRARDYLIIERLKEIEIEKNHINIDYATLTAEVEKIAQRNGMSLSSFKDTLASRFISYDNYVNGLKKQLLEKKLFTHIARSNLSMPSEDEKIIFYNNNQSLFTIAKKIKLIKYESSSKELLMQSMRSPLAVVKNVAKSEEILDVNSLNPQLQYLLLQTKNGTFTQIFPIQNIFTAFFIVSKSDVSITSYKDSQQKIIQMIMSEKEQKSASEYLEKIKNSAYILTLR